MAVHRVTITEGLAFCEQVDHAKIAATTEADVQRYMREDGEQPDGDAEPDAYSVSAALVRTRTGLTQAPFADASDLSVKASRN